jgi:hypothetical protein
MRTMTAMREIYADTLLAVRLNAGYFIAVTALFLVIDWLDWLVIQLALALLMVFQLYRHVLYGDRLSLRTPLLGSTASSFGRFIVVNALVFGILIAATVAIAFGLVGLGLPFDLLADYGTLIILLVLGAYALLLVVFGTALPATVAGETLSDSLSFARTRQTAWGIAAGLLAGPGVVAAMTLTATHYFIDPLGHDLDLTRSENINLVELALSCLVEVASTVQTLMAVVVLCHAYRQVMPRPLGERLEDVFS